MRAKRGNLHNVPAARSWFVYAHHEVTTQLVIPHVLSGAGRCPFGRSR